WCSQPPHGECRRVQRLNFAIGVRCLDGHLAVAVFGVIITPNNIRNRAFSGTPPTGSRHRPGLLPVRPNLSALDVVLARLEQFRLSRLRPRRVNRMLESEEMAVRQLHTAGIAELLTLFQSCGENLALPFEPIFRP